VAGDFATGGQRCLNITVMDEFNIRRVNEDDRDWISELLREWWGGPEVVSRGKLHRADELPGFIAVHENRPAGLITCNIDDSDCEIVTMNSLVERIGIGSALIDAVKEFVVSNGCKRLWLITTNDNIQAIRFYQKYGFVLAAIHRNAMEQSRKLKPEIPLTGNDGIPIRDEIEFELLL
jgi:GNAT superfamily N-acetyltransferase